MYKSRLQELCHQKQWRLPEYSTARTGPDHIPRFTTTVTVNDLTFETPSPAKSSKESQNEAAKLAFGLLTAPPTPLSEPPVVVAAGPSDHPVEPQACENSGGSLYMSDMLASLEELQPQLAEQYVSPGSKVEEQQPVPAATPPEECRAPPANKSSIGVKDDAPVRDVWHLSKNQLQMYAQKRNLPLPTYTSEREGPPHASRFKCKVTVDGKVFESPAYCGTLKDAEHAAAKVALLTLSSNVDQERDSGLYKNLLQELAQKEGYQLPVYDTNGSIVGHVPKFTSTVVIEGESFTGQEARTKKQAEMGAAKIAYITLKDRKRNQTAAKVWCPVNKGPGGSSPSTSSRRNATPDVPLNITPSTDPVPNFTLLKREKPDRVTEQTESKNKSNPLPSPEAEPPTQKSKAPLLPDTIYPQLRDPILEESLSDLSSPSMNSDMLSSAADSTIESPGEEVSLPPRGVVRIYPQSMKVQLPEGSEVALSDENWVAVVAGADGN